MSQIDNLKLFHKGCYIDAVRQMGVLRKSVMSLKN